MWLLIPLHENFSIQWIIDSADEYSSKCTYIRNAYAYAYRHSHAQHNKKMMMNMRKRQWRWWRKKKTGETESKSKVKKGNKTTWKHFPYSILHKRVQLTERSVNIWMCCLHTYACQLYILKALFGKCFSFILFSCPKVSTLLGFFFAKCKKHLILLLVSILLLCNVYYYSSYTHGCQHYFQHYMRLKYRQEQC